MSKEEKRDSTNRGLLPKIIFCNKFKTKRQDKWKRTRETESRLKSGRRRL